MNPYFGGRTRGAGRGGRARARARRRPPHPPAGVMPPPPAAPSSVARPRLLPRPRRPAARARPARARARVLSSPADMQRAATPDTPPCETVGARGRRAREPARAGGDAGGRRGGSAGAKDSQRPGARLVGARRGRAGAAGDALRCRRHTPLAYPRSRARRRGAPGADTASGRPRPTRAGGGGGAGASPWRAPARAPSVAHVVAALRTCGCRETRARPPTGRCPPAPPHGGWSPQPGRRPRCSPSG